MINYSLLMKLDYYKWEVDFIGNNVEKNQMRY